MAHTAAPVCPPPHPPRSACSVVVAAVLLVANPPSRRGRLANAECDSFNDAAHYSKRKQGVVCQVCACAAGMRCGVAPLRAQRAGVNDGHDFVTPCAHRSAATWRS
jgi:hypothetical protein